MTNLLGCFSASSAIFLYFYAAKRRIFFLCYILFDVFALRISAFVVTLSQNVRYARTEQFSVFG